MVYHVYIISQIFYLLCRNMHLYIFIYRHVSHYNYVTAILLIKYKNYFNQLCNSNNDFRLYFHSQFIYLNYNKFKNIERQFWVRQRLVQITATRQHLPFYTSKIAICIGCQHKNHTFCIGIISCHKTMDFIFCDITKVIL